MTAFKFALLASVLALPALADTSTFVFNGNGPTGYNSDVSAVFTVSGPNLLVTLDNTTPNLTYDTQVLTGVYFAYAGAGSNAGAVANPTVQFYNINDGNGQLSKSGGLTTANWSTQIDLSGFVTLTNLNGNHAGSQGVISTTTNTSGTNNLSKHEGYVVGPVQFAISGLNLTSASQITGVEFNFGTAIGTKTGLVSPQTVTGISPTPEPATLGIAAAALLGLLAFGNARRRKAAAAV